MRVFICTVFMVFNTVQADYLPIFDTHLHYNADARAKMSAQQVIDRIQNAGITKALVSSTDDEPTQALIALAPELFVAGLRPYRKHGELRTWMHDPSVLDYLESRLRLNKYKVMGEFHAFGDDILTPVAQQMIALARQYDLVLHHHGDLKALGHIYTIWPQARVIWAHAGFADPDELAPIFLKYPKLWADLSMRSDIHTWGGFSPSWQAIFISYPDRFLLGSDTYTTQRWEGLNLYTQDAQEWLNLLPKPVANKIAFHNAADLLAGE